jgi:uncharacterized Tic20 family protein
LKIFTLDDALQRRECAMTENNPTPPSDESPQQQASVPPPPPPQGADAPTNDAAAPPSATPLPYASPMGPAAPYTGAPPTSEDRTMAVLAHVLGIFTSFVGPLIIWLVKKDQSPFVDDQGREALNFQITLIIGYLISAIATVICIGPILAIALSVVAIIFGIMGAVAANKGEAYRYPFNIRLIK